MYGILSLLLGLLVTKLFRFPAWVTPAIAFNNTTSLPLLLIQSLAATKLLDVIDTSGDAVERSKSYFLLNAMVGNALTFSLGPKLLNVWTEQKKDESEDDDDETLNGQIDDQESQSEQENEESSLLPDRVIRQSTRAEYAVYKKGKIYWRRLPSWVQAILNFLDSFVSPPVIGAAIGALIGLVPALHRLFFNSQQEGGYLNAWLTSALKNVGDLFAALQVVVTGVKLSVSLLRMKKGEAAGRVPLGPLILISVIRFFIWPAISIGVIYALATKTNLLSDDPILWFSMMLMPTGPPALMLTALADISGSEEEQKLSIAKFLTVSIHPNLCPQKPNESNGGLRLSTPSHQSFFSRSLAV